MHITNKNPSLGKYLNDFWQNRTLLMSLYKRDLKIKYAQTRFGILWLFVQPLIAMLVFTIFFDELLQLDTGKVSYPVFVFSGMTIWYYFTNILNSAGSALQQEQELIRKIYFPKLILPASKLLLASTELIASLLILFFLMLWQGVELKLLALTFPIVIVLTMIAGMFLAIWLNVLATRKRDLNHLIPYLVNFGIWFTPVFYPLSIIPPEYHQIIFFLNPIAAIIELFRSIIFGADFQFSYLISLLIIFFLLIWGIISFKNRENTIQDYL